MVKKVLSTVISLFALTYTQNILADVSEVDASKVAIGEPIFSGSGCPEGTVGTAITPDKKTVSFVFDEYVAEAGESAGVKKDTKRCTLVLPLDVPEGFQFIVAKQDYRGYNMIPEKAKTKYFTSYQLLDEKNKRLGRSIHKKYEFKGPLDESYILSEEIENKVWSPCGKKVNLKIDTRILATTNKANEDVMATLDSIDGSVDSELGYHFKWRKCKDDKPKCHK